jgi:hypothetical protein
MELKYRVKHWGVPGDPTVRNDMLTGVITLGRTVPKQETKMKCC